MQIPIGLETLLVAEEASLKRGEISLSISSFSLHFLSLSPFSLSLSNQTVQLEFRPFSSNYLDAKFDTGGTLQLGRQFTTRSLTTPTLHRCSNSLRLQVSAELLI